MTIPPFNAAGDLPPGIYRATLQEVLDRFGRAPTERQIVARRLERVLNLAQSTGYLARFVVFGSFVTEKPDPNDVDIVMVMDDNFRPASFTGEQLLIFDHSAADDYFGCSIFWTHRFSILGGEEKLIEYWQTKRGGGIRGIIEIVDQP